MLRRMERGIHHRDAISEVRKWHFRVVFSDIVDITASYFSLFGKGT